MIRIKKPRRAPEILRSGGDGDRETRRLKRLYDRDPHAYQRGDLTFSFNRDIYTAASVKESLLLAQHDKCCFCESKITHIDFGDVEHYRPKGGYQQTRTQRLQQPGYYWLAYRWDNLFLSCTLCNQRFKKNLFPLEKKSERARSHREWRKLRSERPLFISPSEPAEDFISFRAEIPYARGGNRRGRKTINELGLKRKELNWQRRTTLDLAKSLQTIIEELPGTPHAVRAHSSLQKLQEDDAQYAGMVRAYMRSRA